MELYVGVDGGGSKTEVTLHDLVTEQKVVIRGAASNPLTVGTERAVSTIVSLIDEGLHNCHGTRGDVRGLSLCLAGVDRHQQSASIGKYVCSIFPNAKVEVTNDAFAALTAETGRTCGIVIISGTGSIAVGEGSDGTKARAGGFGNLIGDEGGGFDLGRRGLMVAMQYAEGRGPETELWRLAREAFEVLQPDELIPKIYDVPNPVGAVASFAKHVLETSSYDVVAMKITMGGVESLLGMIESVRTQLSKEIPDDIVFAGSLLTHSAVYRERLIDQIRSRGIMSNLSLSQDSPTTGAVKRALRLKESMTNIQWKGW